MDTTGELKKTRSEIQQEMIDSAVESIDKTGKAAWIASVGIGKSYSALQVVAKYNPPKITWLTSSEELRDIDSQNEFVKWDYSYMLNNCTFMCYQSACKLKDYDFGFLVCDEFDAAITDVYLKAVTNNKFSQGLFITGTITEEKKDTLKQIDIPIVYEVSTNDAQSFGILNKTKVVFVEFDLDTEKTRKIETKFKSWMSSENEQYQYIENQFISQIIQYEALKKQANTHFNVAKIPGFDYTEFKVKKQAISMKLKWIAAQRAKVLHTLDSSKKIARQLSNRLLQNKDNKVLIFSTLTEHLDSFVPNTVHSKNKKGNTVFDDFNEGKIREAGCISVADRGKNFHELNIGLFESYDGSPTKGLQRLGRFCRLLKGNSTIYILVPYYHNKQGKRLPTRAAGWALSMLSSYILNEDNSCTINYKDLKI